MRIMKMKIDQYKQEKQNLTTILKFIERLFHIINYD